MFKMYECVYISIKKDNNDEDDNNNDTYQHRIYYLMVSTFLFIVIVVWFSIFLYLKFIMYWEVLYIIVVFMEIISNFYV